MKKLIVFICFIVLCLPVFAWNEKAETISLQFLNDSVYSSIPNFKQTLYNDNAEIQRIIKLYKQNPEFIKTKEIYNFGLACKKRNQNLLAVYDNEFFKPAYKEYLKLDNSLSFYDWKDSVALSEISLFYDFYTFTESNLIDCEKIIERATNH